MGDVSVQAGGDASVPEVDRYRQLSVSAKFDILSNARRRCLLRYLHDEPECSVRELSRRVAAWENDVPPERVTWKQRKRVYTGLHQTHLPRLDKFGVVDYDCDRGTVRATDRIGLLEPYLAPGDHTTPPATGERRDDGEFPWHLYYAGIGLAALVLSIGMLADVPVLSAVRPVVIVALVAGAVLATVGIQAMQLGPTWDWFDADR